MNVSQGFKMAFSSIFSNKMRSFLTMLGIIIGVFSVTVLVALGQGTTASVTESISSMGTNLLTVNIMTRRTYNITMDDLDTLAQSSNVAAISPYVSTSSTIKAGQNNMSATVEGATGDYLSIRNYTVAQGRSIIQNDLDHRFRVAIIGVDVADELFDSRNVVGESISIDGIAFKIIGVLDEIGTSTMGSGDELVIIPFTTAQRFMQNTTIRTIYASASSEDTVDDATVEIESFLNKELRSDEDSTDSDYRVFDQSSLLETVSEATAALTAMLGGIAAISLLVGGIGIMNIMLVSVTERTREIGIRKSIGAKRRDILFQFLIESIVLSVLGGILGIVLGGIGIKLISGILDMTAVMSANVVTLAVGFSMLVGVVFGLYPANKASKLVPVEALRYE